jgi:hypothetical protein
LGNKYTRTELQQQLLGCDAAAGPLRWQKIVWWIYGTSRHAIQNIEHHAYNIAWPPSLPRCCSYIFPSFVMSVNYWAINI